MPTELDKKAKASFGFIENFFGKYNVPWWIEAGTALSLNRDGKILEWDHDVDIAIWYDDLPAYKEWCLSFEGSPFEVIFQKGLPYLDNIIQLRVKSKFRHIFVDIDVYLYKRSAGKAYMRWLHNPVGLFSKSKRFALICLAELHMPRSERWKKRSAWFPRSITSASFWLYIKIYMATTSCRYHQFDEEMFLELKPISFQGMKLLISARTDDYLSHRYGSDWRSPDPQFNQRGRWRNSKARPVLKMNVLSYPIAIRDFASKTRDQHG